MEFAFNDEQQMIRDTAEAFLQNHSDSAAIRQAMASPLGYDAALWQTLCQDMYWQALHLPEAVGGIGLGYVELVAIVEQMGRHLLCAPYFSTVALAANALLLAGSEAQQVEHLGTIAEGKTASLAFSSSAAFTPDAVTATFTRDGDSVVLSGAYQHVIDGASCELLVLAARDAASGALQLFVAPADAEGIHREAVPGMDQTRRRAKIQLDGLRLPAAAQLGEFENAEAPLQQCLDLACIALAAEQVGLMQQLLDMAVAYTGERQQFNRPIASFQAVKHIAAEMMLRTEVGRSAIYYAACIADEFLAGTASASALAEAASVAKAWCSEAAFKNAGDTLQLHGGVGFTWEYDVHLFFKRAKASEHLLGNSDEHRERIAAMLLDEVN